MLFGEPDILHSVLSKLVVCIPSPVSYAILGLPVLICHQYKVEKTIILYLCLIVFTTCLLLKPCVGNFILSVFTNINTYTILIFCQSSEHNDVD